MTIAFDAASNGRLASYGSQTVSIPHTCTGVNRALAVLLSSDGSGVSGVTYNGVAMTLVTSNILQAPKTFIYVLANPASGTHNIVVNASSVYLDAAIIGASFTGVDQTTPVQASSSASNGFQTSPGQISAAPAAGNMVVDVIGHGDAATALTVQGSQNEIAGQAGFTTRVAASYLLDSTVMGWTWSTGTNQVSHSVLVLAAAAASLPDLSGTATLGDITASGSLSSGASDVSGSATLGDITASGTLSSGMGTLTSPVLKNNTGTILASVSGIVCNVYHPTTGVLILRKTGLASNGAGIVTFSDALVAAGTTYAYELDLSATAQGRRLPTVVAT